MAVQPDQIETAGQRGLSEQSPLPSQDPSPNRLGLEAISKTSFGSPKKPASIPVWIRTVPFFLSAFLFMTGLFAILSPLPLILLAFRTNRKWAYSAILTNFIWVALLMGEISAGLYLVMSVAVSVGLIESLKRYAARPSERRSSGFKVEIAAGLSLGLMALISLGILFYYSHLHHTSPWVEIRTQMHQTVEYLGTQMTGAGMVPASELDDWKERLLVEFPSAAGIFALLIVWMNLILVLRMNPGSIRDRLGLEAGYGRNWRAPEKLIWPTIASGFCLLFIPGLVSDVSLNIFKVVMAVYAIQGLCVLSFFLDVWKAGGLTRTLAFMGSVFVLTPLLLSLGFFDLWFDFRSKIRQT